MTTRRYLVGVRRQAEAEVVVMAESVEDAKVQAMAQARKAIQPHTWRPFDYGVAQVVEIANVTIAQAIEYRYEVGQDVVVFQDADGMVAYPVIGTVISDDGVSAMRVRHNDSILRVRKAYAVPLVV